MSPTPTSRGIRAGSMPAAGQLQQAGMVVGGGANVERLPQGRGAGPAGDGLVDQHQQAHLLEGSPQHQLQIRGARAAGAGGLELFAAVTAAQVGGQMQKERVAQPGGAGLAQQLLHQLLRQGLQILLAGDVAAHGAQQGIEVEAGGEGVVEHRGLHQGLHGRSPGSPAAGRADGAAAHRPAVAARRPGSPARPRSHRGGSPEPKRSCSCTPPAPRPGR